ncbi:MAG TPA: BTAD domain-containing putative transcriptional regulator [Gemmatimonadales bacterium]|nr:BTAD domain-containing putative transcriptional regulator [Gemmatimonadales bacterium]
MRIHALGGLFVEREGRVLAGAAAQPRRLAVLALLARAGQRGVSRDKLLGVLWPDQEEEKGRRALTQALYALRQELGSEEAITGSKDLRLDSALVGSDVGDFTLALAEGRTEEAVGLYEGPFLDGFHLAGAEEFEKWVDQERQALAHDFAEGLRTLAGQAGERGDADAAVRWWKRLAALDPLDSRSSVALMRALAAAGDARGALQHARIHELLMQEELDLPPDREVAALAAEIRAGLEGGTRGAGSGERGAGPAAAPPPEILDQRAPIPTPPPRKSEPRTASSEPRPATPSPGPWAPGSGEAEAAPRQGHADPLVWAAAVAVIVAAIALIVTLGRRSGEPPLADPARVAEAAGAMRADSGPVVVVGRVADYTGQELAGALGDMLGTNLARAPQLRVVSTARMYELLRDRRDTSGAAILAAARSAGATELLEGALHARGGSLRLDLRRLDLVTGDVREAWTVIGAEPFALADSATARIIAALDLPALGSLAEVTTRSVDAWRSYEAGLRHYYAGELRRAEERFQQAMIRDQQFAMATFYHALCATDGVEGLVRMENARRLAGRASERERLLITAAWAELNTDPSLRAVAETLTTRFPGELEGWVYLATGLLNAGEVAAAREPLHQAVQADTAGFATGQPNCTGCRALHLLSASYEHTDSAGRAARMLELWTRLQPDASDAWRSLAYSYGRVGRHQEAIAAMGRADSALPRDQWPTRAVMRAQILIWAERWDDALALVLPEARGSAPRERARALWWVAYNDRHRGRFAEALNHARGYRAVQVRSDLPEPGTVDPEAVLEALALLDVGNPLGSAALFDSIARFRWPKAAASHEARQRAWMLTHGAAGLAEAGDTVALRVTVQRVREAGSRSGLIRDRLLHHHVAGLLWKVRGQRDSAIAAFRASLFSLTVGYTRTNLELGRLLLEKGDAAEAVRIVQPALRGGLDGSPLYVNRTELHGLLGEAWAAAGNPDSARTHLGQAIRNWEGGDERARQAAARWRAVMGGLGAFN